MQDGWCLCEHPAGHTSACAEPAESCSGSDTSSAADESTCDAGTSDACSANANSARGGAFTCCALSTNCRASFEPQTGQAVE